MMNNEHARILSKGKSLEATPWRVLTKYVNNCLMQHIVSYKDALLLCTLTHVADLDNEPVLLYEDTEAPNKSTGVKANKYWRFLLSGPQGQDGRTIVIRREDNGDVRWGYEGDPLTEYNTLFTISELSGANAIHIGDVDPITFKELHQDDPEIQARYAYAEDMIWEDNLPEEIDPETGDIEVYSKDEIDEKLSQMNDDWSEQLQGIQIESPVQNSNRMIVYTNGSQQDPIEIQDDDIAATILSHEYNRDLERWEIIFNHTITEIPMYLFVMSNIIQITLPESVTVIGESAFEGCDNLQSITIPNNVIEIEEMAFCECSNLTSVTIGNSVTKIGSDAFNGCSSLTSITIPDGVTFIGEGAFSGCSRLTNVTIPDSVISIRNYAFYNCSSLTSVYCKSVTPPACGTHAFHTNASERIIYVSIEPADILDTYKSATNWSEYADYIEGCVFEDEHLVSGTNIKTLNGESILGKGNLNIVSDNIIEITYSDLVNLRDNSNLIPGMQYRITDYVTATSQEYTQSAGHQFDIIVTAIDDHTLSEDAKAAYSENDTYFEDNNANLSVWELKYCLDNDVNRFAWAGKLVEREIYESSACTINEELINGNAFITPFSFESCVWVDADGDEISYVGADGESNHDILDLIYEWGYYQDENGVIQLCLYKSESSLYEEEGHPDYSDAYLYRGVTTIDGVKYDYWQKSEESAGVYIDSEVDSAEYVFATTPCIVSNPEAYFNSVVNEDISNSKGVIYYMKDEWNNECPYDFKNIMFTRYKLNAPETLGYGNWIDKMAENIQYQFNQSSLPYIWGGLLAGENRVWEDDYGELHSTQTGEYKEFYTFSNVIDGVITDKSITNNYCYGNVIKEYISDNKIVLNNIVFFNTDNIFQCSSNSFGNNCHSNTFGDDCRSNSFGVDCYSNSFGNRCYYNSFGNNCFSNSLGNYYHSNSLGNNCYSNSFGNYYDFNFFGDDCYSNSFGDDCGSNSFGGACFSNSFGDDCYSNSFGDDCYSNSLGNYCYSNSFGNYCTDNSFGNYYQYNSFGDGCQYITLVSAETASSSNQVQNYKLAQGLQGTSSSPLTINAERSRVYETKVAKNSSGDLKIYCEADLIA